MTKTPDSKEPRRKPRESPGPKVRDFLEKWGTWIGIAAMFFAHIRLVAINIGMGVHEVLPAYADMEVGSLEAWIDTIPRLFFKPDTVLQILRMYSLWVFFFVFLCLYGALRVGDSVPRGVLMLISVGLAGVVLLGVVTPAAWILFADNGPLVVELVPPFILGGIAVLLEYSTRRMMIVEE